MLFALHALRHKASADSMASPIRCCLFNAWTMGLTRARVQGSSRITGARWSWSALVSSGWYFQKAQFLHRWGGSDPSLFLNTKKAVKKTSLYGIRFAWQKGFFFCTVGVALTSLFVSMLKAVKKELVWNQVGITKRHICCPDGVALPPSPVSYTHLRAHET